MTTMQQMASSQASPEVIVNDNFDTVSAVAIFGREPRTTSAPGLTWGYLGGLYNGNTVADGTVTLTDAATNYVVVLRSTGVVSVSTSPTNGADPLYAQLYKVTTSAGDVVTYVDQRMDSNGLLIGSPGTGGTSVAEGLQFTASSTTTDSDPGTGTLRWNNATQASATILYIDNADADSTSLATLWASLTAGAFLKIIDAGDADVWQLWKVSSTPTNGTGYYKFAVTLQAQEGGNIANATAIVLDVDAGGSAGAAWGGITGTLASQTDLQAALDAKQPRAPNVQSVASAGTVTPTFANDLVRITAQAASLTLANPTGTAIEGLGIAIRIKDNGTARAISYDTQYRAIGVTLPTTTVINKTLYLGCVWNDTDTKLDVVAVAQEA